MLASHHRILVAVVVCLVAGSAHAQQPAPAAAIDVPPMTCTNPGAAPLDRTGSDLTRFQKRLDDYKTCVNQYTQSTGAKSNEYAAQSRAYADAANKAIDDYNAYVTGLNEAAKTKGK